MVQCKVVNISLLTQFSLVRQAILLPLKQVLLLLAEVYHSKAKVKPVCL
jgi:hypothetical protein